MKYQCGFYVKHILQSRAEKRAYGYGGMIFRVKPVRPANETGQKRYCGKGTFAESFFAKTGICYKKYFR